MEGKIRVLFFTLILDFIITVKGSCPEQLPAAYKGFCFGIQVEVAKYKDAQDKCRKLHEKADFAPLTEIPSGTVKLIHEIINSKLNNSFWIGMEMKENSASTDLGKRKWTFLYDETTVVQSDYGMWEKEPTDGSLKCTILHKSDVYRVKAVDCGQNASPVICMKKDEPCKHDDLPWLQYGDYCFLPLLGNYDYGEMISYCKPDSPAAIKDERMLRLAMNAARNMYVGGASLIAAKRFSSNIFLYDNGNVLSDDMWDQDEPRRDYDCVGLFVNERGEGKLRTVSCDISSTIVCYMVADALFTSSYYEGLK